MTAEEHLKDRVTEILLKGIPTFVRGLMGGGVDWVARKIVEVSQEYVERKLAECKSKKSPSQVDSEEQTIAPPVS